MPYQNNIPQPNQRLKDSQPDLLANFQALKQLIDVNHATFSSANEGKHNLVTMPEQVGDPATLINEISMYTKAVAGVTQLFLRNENNGSVVNFTSRDTTLANGSTTLTSGIILKWGRGVTPIGGTIMVTFTTPFPTGILTAYAVASNPAGVPATPIVARVYTFSAANMNVETFFSGSTIAGAANFCWFAIGH